MGVSIWEGGKAERLATALENVADSIGNVISPEAVAANISEDVTAWLDENVESGETLVVDNSLTIQGAAADAKKAGDEISTLKSALNINDFFTNNGTFQIKAADLESGQWSYSTKSANTARARLKYLIPVKAGMSISYSSSTYDVYCGVLATPTSSAYAENMGWKNGTGAYNITQDGYMTFIIRNHADTSATVNPADYNGTVVVSTSDESEAELVKNALVRINFPGNLVDPAQCIDRCYVSANYGTIVYNTSAVNISNMFVTGFLPVTPGETYIMNRTLGTSYAYYNSSKAYVSGDNFSSNKFTVPDGAAYIRITVSKSSIKSPYEFYVINEKNYIDGVTIYGKPIGSLWTVGKTINWIGDSIIANFDADNIVAANLGMTENDYGINASFIAQRSDDPTASDPMCIRYADMTDDADIIAVSGGTNDFATSKVQLGQPTDNVTTTFYGALNTMMSGLLAKYPGKVIFFTTPLKRADDGKTQESTDVYGNTLKDYRDAIIERGAYWGIPVLDLWAESGLNPTIAEHAQFFWNDKLHPSDAGRVVIARRLIGWIKQLGSNPLLLHHSGW